jgi:hypothetical protein
MKNRPWFLFHPVTGKVPWVRVIHAFRMLKITMQLAKTKTFVRVTFSFFDSLATLQKQAGGSLRLNSKIKQQYLSPKHSSLHQHISSVSTLFEFNFLTAFHWDRVRHWALDQTV